MVTRAWELAAGALVALSLPLAVRLERRLAECSPGPVSRDELGSER